MNVSVLLIAILYVHAGWSSIIFALIYIHLQTCLEDIK